MYTTIAYNYLNSKDVNSIEAEITGDAFAFNPVVGNANNDVLSYSKYGDTHRFIGVFSKKFNYGNDKWATTVSSFFEYAQGGRFNYTYGGDINGDGSVLNDLLYVPTADELQQMQFSGAGQAEAFVSGWFADIAYQMHPKKKKNATAEEQAEKDIVSRRISKILLISSFSTITSTSSPTAKSGL